MPTVNLDDDVDDDDEDDDEFDEGDVDDEEEDEDPDADGETWQVSTSIRGDILPAKFPPSLDFGQ